MEDKWISVKDRLPERGGNCIVYKTFANSFSISIVWFDVSINNFANHDLEVWTVSHWMPLPSAPKYTSK